MEGGIRHGEAEYTSIRNVMDACTCSATSKAFTANTTSKTAHVANEKEDNMQKHQIMQAVPDSARSEIGGATDLGIFAEYVNLRIQM